MTFAVAIAIANIQAKHKYKMLSLWKMIEKFLLLRESASATSSPNFDTIPKAHLGADFLPKTIAKRWNQVNLGYFDPHLDRAHSKGEIVLVDKDVYYKNVVLFVQHLQSLVTIKEAALIKANITISLRGSALE